MSNLRAKILSMNDIESEIVFIPQWKCDVLVKGMTGKERSVFLQNTLTTKGKEVKMDFSKMYTDLIIIGCYDPETGERLFLPEDKEALEQKSAAAIETLSKVVSRLSGLEETSQEELKKNSEKTQKGTSITH